MTKHEPMIVNTIRFIESGQRVSLLFGLSHFGCDRWRLNNCPTERVGHQKVSRRNKNIHIPKCLSMISSSSPLQTTEPRQTVTLSGVPTRVHNALIRAATSYYDWNGLLFLGESTKPNARHGGTIWVYLL